MPDTALECIAGYYRIAEIAGMSTRAGGLSAQNSRGSKAPVQVEVFEHGDEVLNGIFSLPGHEGVGIAETGQGGFPGFAWGKVRGAAEAALHIGFLAAGKWAGVLKWGIRGGAGRPGAAVAALTTPER
jgi:hypothetical protein